MSFSEYVIEVPFSMKVFLKGVCYAKGRGGPHPHGTRVKGYNA